MKKTSLFGAMTLVAALTFAQPVVLGAFVSTPAYAAEINERNVLDEAELRAALADATVTGVALTDNITLTSTFVIDRDFTIDLNGYNITSTTDNIRLFDIKKGNVIITGEGEISTTGNGGLPFRVYGSTDATAENYTVLTVGAGVKVVSPTLYGLLVASNNGHAYGVVINFSGELDAAHGMTVNGQITDTTSNAPVINILDGAKIVVDGGGIYAAGFATWNIGAATIEGDTAIITKAGVFNLTNTTLTGTGAPVDGSVNSNGAYGAGSAIQIESNANYAGKVEININGGTYTSQQGAAFYSYGDDQNPVDHLESIDIEKGIFASADGYDIFAGYIAPEEVEITDGSFNQDVIGFIGADTKLTEVEDEDGNITYVIAGGIYEPKAEVPAEPGVDAPNSGALAAETSATALSAVAATAALATIAGAAVIVRRRA